MKFKTLIPKKRVNDRSNVTFNINTEKLNEFRRLCKQNKINQSDIISIAIEQAIEELKHV
jgi:uncharacterized protein YdbL (DUF1318 family)